MGVIEFVAIRANIHASIHYMQINLKTNAGE
jgi:hypothetical protein